MKKITSIVLFLFLFSSFVRSQNKIEPNAGLYKTIQHSNEVKLKELGDLSIVKGSKHIERYRWEESNALNEDGTIIPQNVRIKNYLAQLRQQKVSSAANWIPIGLTEWRCGNSGYNPGNGRLNAITVDPNDSMTIYVCAASGGLWKSNDGGTTWNTNTDAFPVLGTSDIAVDPNNSDILYLATGDRDGLDTYGVGIYKSTDGGATWNPSGLFNNFSSEAFVINAIEIDPQRSNVIYAGSNNGLYKSVDSGNTWNKVISSGKIMEVKVNSMDTNTVFAISRTKFYRSRDQGNSFVNISNGLALSPVRIAMDITPADTAKVYIISAASNANNSKIFVSNDGGSSFIQKFSSATQNLLGYSEDGSGHASQAYYDLAIAVSKTDTNNVYVGGINVWHSIDGGLSWTSSTSWTYNTQGRYAHADIHSLDFYGNTLFCGSDGGIAKNRNNTAWQNLSSGLNISQIYGFSNSTDGKKIAIACQDNGVNVSSNGVWSHVMGADGISTLVNPLDSNIVFLSIQNGKLFISTTGGDNVNNVFNPEDDNISSSFFTPIDMCRSKPNVLSVGLADVYNTTDNGENWTKISSFTNSDFCKLITIAPSSSNYTYLVKNNVFYYTHNAGTTWNHTNGLGSGSIMDIAVSNSDSLSVYLLVSNMSSKIYHSVDGGQSFTVMPNVLSNVSSRKIALENGIGHGIYLAAELGVYYTNDFLSSWINYSDDLPFVKVNDIEIVNDKVRVATYGRGVWESDLYLTTSINTAESLKSKVSLSPNPTDGRFTINTKGLKISSIEIFNVAGALVQTYSTPLSYYSISDLVNGVYFIRITTDKGVVVKRLIKS